MATPAALAARAGAGPTAVLEYHKPGPAFRLFADPPEEIGPILFAGSTLRQGRRHLSLAVRLAAGLVPAAFLAAAILAWAEIPEAPGVRPGPAVVAVLFAAGAFAAAWHLTRFEHRCGYVGRDGVADFHLRGRRDAPPSSRVLLFRDAAVLKTSQARPLFSGVFTGTVYDYRWVDAAGLRRFQLCGTHWTGFGAQSPGAADPFHFAAAAETAWSFHLLSRAQQQLDREGSVPFPVDDRRVVRVGRGFLEFHFGDAPLRVTRDDIATVILSGGEFSFVPRDPGRHHAAGRCRFAQARMPNAKAFLVALETLVGCRIV